MGQQYSHPKPGAKLQVIGAGLPRTGTASFSRALEILLDGPVYHGGTQSTLGPEAEIKTWIKVLNQWLPKDETARRANLDLIKSRTDGFVAITDSPGCGLVSELMTLSRCQSNLYRPRSRCLATKHGGRRQRIHPMVPSLRSIPTANDALLRRLHRCIASAMADHVWRKGASDKQSIPPTRHLA
ncbi:hypothetical protein CDV31_011018 [Fusarium ambrosium]|uniref:Uncharacterized protein n=1 Tax=Fusarium ambrosium TaxID=131363 RepID=A0A428TJG1_9HYPO|nr:hypothetical protein CDV31_011018 [Fusarium ambrosium]